MLERIEPELEALTILLDLAKWYDKELEKIDDSDGTNQELQMNIIMKAAECGLGNPPLLIFEKIKPYLEYRSSFDFSDLILSAFFEIKKPNEIAEYLGVYCKKNHGEPWQRCKEYWCRYLKEINDLRFETEARKYFPSNISILVLLIEYYGKIRQIGKAIEVGWRKRGHFMVGDLMVKLLKKEKDYRHLAILLKERLVKDWDKNEARLLKNVLGEIDKVDEWEAFIDNLVINAGGSGIKLRMLMFLKRYAEVAEIVIKADNWPFINAEEYAEKLTILDKESAKKVYWHLVLKEVKKFERSSYYKKFWKFIGALEKLESQKKMKNYLSEVRKKIS